MARHRSNYTPSGQVRPLRERKPGMYWTAMVVSLAMVLSLVASGVAIFL